MCQTQIVNYIAHMHFSAHTNYSTCTVFSRQRLTSSMPCMLMCPLAMHAIVPMCLACLCAHVPTCLAC